MLNNAEAMREAKRIYSDLPKLCLCIEASKSYRERLIATMKLPAASVYQQVYKFGGDAALSKAHTLLDKAVVDLSASVDMCEETKQALKYLLTAALESSLIAMCCDKDEFWSYVGDKVERLN